MWIPALLATHLTILRELIKDIEDYDGDSKAGIKTFPVCCGIKNGTRLFLFLLLLLIIWAGFLPVFIDLNPYYIQSFWLLFSPWIFFIVYLLIWKNNIDYAKMSNLLKIATALGLIVIATFGL